MMQFRGKNELAKQIYEKVLQSDATNSLALKGMV
jgi:hypothetical protein